MVTQIDLWTTRSSTKKTTKILRKQWSGRIKNEQSKSNSVMECGEVAITLSHTEW